MDRSKAHDSIVLLACCGPKLGKPAPAADLYVSSLFKKARTYAERRGRWFNRLFSAVDSGDAKAENGAASVQAGQRDRQFDHSTWTLCPVRLSQGHSRPN